MRKERRKKDVNAEIEGGLLIKPMSQHATGRIDTTNLNL